MSEEEKVKLILKAFQAERESTKSQGSNNTLNKLADKAYCKLFLEFVGRAPNTDEFPI